MPTAWIGAVDDDAFTILDGKMGTGDGYNAEEQNYLSGYAAPKEISFCQHVVSGNDGHGVSISSNSAVAGQPISNGGAAANGAPSGLTELISQDKMMGFAAGDPMTAEWLQVFGGFQEKMAQEGEPDFSEEFALVGEKKTTLGGFAQFGDICLQTGQHFSSGGISLRL